MAVPSMDEDDRAGICAHTERLAAIYDRFCDPVPVAEYSKNKFRTSNFIILDILKVYMDKTDQKKFLSL
jgi:hypothetical protein